MSNSQDLTHVESMWGIRILDAGFTNLPNLIIRHATRVGLTRAEFHLISIILTFKHDTEDPFPSQETIARYYFGHEYKADSSERSIRRLLKSLEEKDLVEVYFDYDKRGKRSSSIYNFQPLIDAVLELDVVEQQAKPKRNLHAKNKNKKNTTTGTKTSGSADIKNTTTGTKTSGSEAKKRPTKKNSLKKDIKKTIKKDSQSTEEQILSLEMSDKVKEYLKTKTDGLTDNILSSIQSLYKQNIVTDEDVFIDKLKKTFKYNRDQAAFESYLEKCLIFSKDENNPSSQPAGRKSVRKEVMSDEMKKHQEEADKKAENQPKSVVAGEYKRKNKTHEELITLYKDPVGRESLTDEEKMMAEILSEPVVQ